MTIPAFFSQKKAHYQVAFDGVLCVGKYDSISLLSDLSLTSIEMFFSGFVMPGYGFGFVS